MHTPSFADYVRRIDADDWDGVAELMLGSARRLAGAGAQFLICPDNTIHRALPAVVDRSPLLWLDMPEVVVLEARLRGFRRVGLTGTRWLVESDVYPTRSAAAGVELVRPERAEIDELHRIIMDELVCGVFRRQSVAYVRQVIARMKRAGCDAVILGCTELPLIVDDRSSPLPTLDSTRLLARAALDHAVSVRVEAGHGPRG